MTVFKWLLFVFRCLGLPEKGKHHRGKKPQNHSGGGFDVYLLDQSNGSL
jgi:hypothetical protein